MSKSKRPRCAAKALEEVAWLGHVREVRHPLSQTRPLWVKHVQILSGGSLPEPATPSPEWHPYCEFSYIFQGRLMQYVGGESLEKRAGDLMLLNAGTPHYAMHLSYPLRYVTVYFLPALLFELAPEGDGARVMRRFIGAKSIAERVVRPPADLQQQLAGRFEQMLAEFSAWGLGSELRLRALLIENLVDLLRWEESAGRAFTSKTPELKWLQIEKALHYIHAHYGEPLYVAQIARETGSSVAHLQEIFKRALGMSCIQYLRSYRISHAAALLQTSEAQVTEVALAVGFESLGHFNTSFRSAFGISPTQYRLACGRNPR